MVISLAGLFFGREGVQQEVTQAIRGLLGDKGSEAVNAMLMAAGAPSEGVFASVIGTVTRHRRSRPSRWSPAPRSAASGVTGTILPRASPG